MLLRCICRILCQSEQFPHLPAIFSSDVFCLRLQDKWFHVSHSKSKRSCQLDVKMTPTSTNSIKAFFKFFMTCFLRKFSQTSTPILTLVGTATKVSFLTSLKQSVRKFSEKDFPFLFHAPLISKAMNIPYSCICTKSQQSL